MKATLTGKITSMHRVEGKEGENIAVELARVAGKIEGAQSTTSREMHATAVLYVREVEAEKLRWGQYVQLTVETLDKPPEKP